MKDSKLANIINQGKRLYSAGMSLEDIRGVGSKIRKAKDRWRDKLAEVVEWEKALEVERKLNVLSTKELIDFCNE